MKKFLLLFLFLTQVSFAAQIPQKFIVTNVVDAVNNGTTTTAPSQNAVYDFVTAMTLASFTGAKIRFFRTTSDYSNTGNSGSSTTVTDWVIPVEASKHYLMACMLRLHTAAAAVPQIIHRPSYPTSPVANYATCTGAAASNQNITSQPPADDTQMCSSLGANNADYSGGLVFFSFTNGTNAGNFTYKFRGPNTASAHSIMSGSVCMVVEVP